MIGGFELPDYGTVRIGGKDVTMLPPYRRDVNTVFQNYALFPHMDARKTSPTACGRTASPGSERASRA